MVPAPSRSQEMVGWGRRPPLIVTDCGYGHAAKFRHGLTERGLAYVVRVSGRLTAYPAETARTAPEYWPKIMTSITRGITDQVSQSRVRVAVGSVAARSAFRRGTGADSPPVNRRRLLPQLGAHATPPPAVALGDITRAGSVIDAIIDQAPQVLVRTRPGAA
jgi:hypothetical protein